MNSTYKTTALFYNANNHIIGTQSIDSQINQQQPTSRTLIKESGWIDHRFRLPHEVAIHNIELHTHQMEEGSKQSNTLHERLALQTVQHALIAVTSNRHTGAAAKHAHSNKPLLNSGAATVWTTSDLAPSNVTPELKDAHEKNRSHILSTLHVDLKKIEPTPCIIL